MKAADKIVRRPRRYRGPNIPMTAIRRFARQIAEKFHPDMIVLFGSYAYGKPHHDSDIDLLVIMPTRDVMYQAIKISLSLEHPFPMDIMVRTPRMMSWRLSAGDCFLREIMEKGNILYEKDHQRMGGEGRGRSARSRDARSGQSAPK